MLACRSPVLARCARGVHRIVKSWAVLLACAQYGDQSGQPRKTPKQCPQSYAARAFDLLSSVGESVVLVPLEAALEQNCAGRRVGRTRGHEQARFGRLLDYNKAYSRR
jgi:hypothetical protein